MTASPHREDPVLAQYERYPYPPLPWLKLPHWEQQGSLSWSQFQNSALTEKPEILILGAGTFEPLLVKMQNPHAARITAVEMSHRSIEILKKRAHFFGWMERLRTGSWFRNQPRVEIICADFLSWASQGGENRWGRYDYVIISNVLHHLPDPAQGLAQASRFLKPGGILRMVTYPRLSRTFMRATSRYFRKAGIRGNEPNLRALCASLILQLPETHPFRATYRSCPEIITQAGLVDAFFHAREIPLSPLDWAKAGQLAGLSFLAQLPSTHLTTGECSHQWIDSWFPETLQSAVRDQSWFTLWKLDLLDSLLELDHNLVLCWMKRSSHERVPEIPQTPLIDTPKDLPQAWKRVSDLLQIPNILKEPLSLETVLERVRTQAEPGRYRGLRLQDYPL